MNIDYMFKILFDLCNPDHSNTSQVEAAASVVRLVCILTDTLVNKCSTTTAPSRYTGALRQKTGDPGCRMLFTGDLLIGKNGPGQNEDQWILQI